MAAANMKRHGNVMVPEAREITTWPVSSGCRRAVSYTHLDVYKRQMLTGASSIRDVLLFPQLKRKDS